MAIAKWLLTVDCLAIGSWLLAIGSCVCHLLLQQLLTVGAAIVL